MGEERTEEAPEPIFDSGKIERMHQRGNDQVSTRPIQILIERKSLAIIFFAPYILTFGMKIGEAKQIISMNEKRAVRYFFLQVHNHPLSFMTSNSNPF